ncbi:hypothetical protein RXV95_00570 [Novosphingobium sp. ZN18A2]|uniref:hypothetical protein n=1 Tax=Novosphingobium sp. ZN18A2 TaxID=3079861 RepID=UPI0030CBE11E
MKIARSLFALSALAALSACGSKDTDPGPGGVTVGEARTLDQAAEMLDKRQLPPSPQAGDASQGAAPQAPAATASGNP